MDTYVTLAKKHGGKGLPTPETVDPDVPAHFTASMSMPMGSAEDRAIWHYKHPVFAAGPTENDGVTVKQLRCMPEAAHEPMVVCESIFWRNVKVRIAGKEFVLPLKKQYMIASLGVSGGKVSASAPVPWGGYDQNVDIGFDLWFRFRFNARFDAFAPAPAETRALKASDVDDSYLTQEERAQILSASTSARTVFTVNPNDIDVVVSLVCCKQSPHFTPLLPKFPSPLDRILPKTNGASPLSVARFFPLTLVRPVFNVEIIDTATRIMRPAKAFGHVHGDEDLRGELSEKYHDKASKVKLQSGVLPNYSVSMYADNNHPLGGLEDPIGGFFNEAGAGGSSLLFGYRELAPTWERTFSHFHTALRADEEYLAVMPRQIWRQPVKVEGSEYDVAEPRKISSAVWASGNWRDIEKRPGQALFDNIHIAPMMSDPVAVDRLAKNGLPARGFDAISMAPFCVHDCLHVHWRWLSWAPMGSEVASWNKGWSEARGAWPTGKPYCESGATMVPDNQLVSIKLKAAVEGHAPHGFVYRAKALIPERYQWQVFFHHGGAYSALIPPAASAIASDAQPARNATLDPGLVVTSGSPGPRGGTLSTNVLPSEVNWARFYWHLRYEFHNGVVERVQYPQWHALNELPLLKDSALAVRIQAEIVKVRARGQPKCDVISALRSVTVRADSPSAGTGAPLVFKGSTPKR
jgi:hypothetical protein